MNVLRKIRLHWMLVAGVLFAGCGAIPATTSPTCPAVAAPAPTDVLASAQTPAPSSAPALAPTLLPREEPPARGSEFKTDFSKHSVLYAEILSGGPPKDGIPAIDNPTFVSITQADEWLKPNEPIILFEVGGEARLPDPDPDLARDRQRYRRRGAGRRDILPALQHHDRLRAHRRWAGTRLRDDRKAALQQSDYV